MTTLFKHKLTERLAHFKRTATINDSVVAAAELLTANLPRSRQVYTGLRPHYLRVRPHHRAHPKSTHLDWPHHLRRGQTTTLFGFATKEFRMNPPVEQITACCVLVVGEAMPDLYGTLADSAYRLRSDYDELMVGECTLGYGFVDGSFESLANCVQILTARSD
jgi:hypothetical protein